MRTNSPAHRMAACFAVLGCLAALPSPPARASNCNAPPTGFVPITDLGAGTYQGVEGGLYGGGANQRPAAHNAAGVSIATSLAPLDTAGNPDPTHGRVVLASIGMSNATLEFSAFVPIAMSWPQRNPQLNVIDCAEGGMSVDRILNSASPYYHYWDDVAAKLRSHGSAPGQVQAVWIKEAIATPTGSFTPSTDTLMHEMAALVRLIHQKLPNVKLAYFTSRIYAGYASSNLNPEPYAYQSAFAIRSVIQQQIAGVDSLNYDPANGPVQAPWLAWGPYLWADGMTPRSDGLTWACSEFQSDGTHPAASAQTKVADSLLVFFGHDETTRPWFASATVAVAGGAVPRTRMAIAPNPARGTLTIRFTPPATAWRLSIADASGRLVRELASGSGAEPAMTRSWDGRDRRGTPVRAGLYFARLAAGSGSIDQQRFVRLETR